MGGWLPDVGTLTPAALLGIGVMMILLGKLRPESAFRELRADRDATIARLIAERDAYKTASEIHLDTIRKQADALSGMTEVGETANSLIRMLKVIVQTGGVDGPQRPV